MKLIAVSLACLGMLAVPAVPSAFAQTGAATPGSTVGGPGPRKDKSAQSGSTAAAAAQTGAAEHGAMGTGPGAAPSAHTAAGGTVPTPGANPKTGAGPAPTGGAGTATDAMGASATGGLKPDELESLRKLHESNQKEIAMGTLAADKGTDAKVKAYGKRLVSDHTAADKKVAALLKKKKLTMDVLGGMPAAGTTPTSAAGAGKAAAPSAPGGGAGAAAAHEGMGGADEQKLAGLTGADFDKQFTSMMVEDHEKDIAATKAAHEAATDPQVKSLLGGILPTLEKHRKMASDISDKLNKTKS